MKIGYTFKEDSPLRHFDATIEIKSFDFDRPEPQTWDHPGSSAALYCNDAEIVLHLPKGDYKMQTVDACEIVNSELQEEALENLYDQEQEEEGENLYLAGRL